MSSPSHSRSSPASTLVLPITFLGAALLAAPEADLAHRTEEARTGSFQLVLRGTDGKPLPGVEVAVEQVRHDFLFGANIYVFDAFQDSFQNQAYKRRFEEVFNYATLPFYWNGYEKERGRPQHGLNERIAGWCAARGIATKGHPLVWTHEAGVPDWLKALPDSEVSAAVLARLRDAVKTFRGRIGTWDVLNEPFHTPPFKGFADREAQVKAVFAAAREEDPGAKLVLNEYDLMSEGAGEFLPFVERCLAAGAAIDAVGIQAHEPRFARFDPDRMDAVLDRCARLGKEVHLTELAFTSGGQKVLRRGAGGSFKETDETWTEDLQAKVVEEFYRRAFAHPAVAAITWWDLADFRSWLPGGGLLRKDLSEKPAYAVLRRLIREEWWTRKRLHTDAEGRIAFRGYFGDYRVRAFQGERFSERIVHLAKGASGAVSVDLSPPWRVEPERPRGAFSAGETPAFVLEGSGDPPGVRILAADGLDRGAVKPERTSEGRFRVAAPGLEPGPYRLVLDLPGGMAGPSSSFALLPERPAGLPGKEGAIACDGAISWLVAHPRAKPSDVADTLRLAHLAGLGILRDRIAWGEVEPSPGEYRWGRYDAVASASKEAGLDVYQIFHASPHWSRSDHDSKRMPDDLRDAHRFARAAGERFRGRVSAWEPWNEPDITAFSEDPADQLAAFQKAACLGFKAADPGGKVLMVSLAMAPGLFIEGFLENETASYFDVYNYHTYEPLEGYERRAAVHARVRERFGIAGKPVWVTEAGIPLRTPTGDLKTEDALRQAEFLPRAYVLSLAGGTSRHFFFILPHYIENDVQFGLLTRDLAPGPGYSALAALTAALGDAKDPRALRGLPSGATGWLFARGDGLEAAAVWAAEKVRLPLAGGLEARDLHGAPIKAAGDGTLEAGPRVSYIIGKPEGFSGWKPEAPARPAGAPPPAPPGLPGIVLRFVFPADRSDKAKEAWRVGSDGTLDGRVQAYNFTSAEFKGKVRIGGEDGLRIDPAEKEVRIDAGGLVTLEVELRWESGGGIHRARAIAEPGAPAETSARSSAAVARIVKP